MDKFWGVSWWENSENARMRPGTANRLWSFKRHSYRGVSHEIRARIGLNGSATGKITIPYYTIPYRTVPYRNTPWYHTLQHHATSHHNAPHHHTIPTRTKHTTTLHCPQAQVPHGFPPDCGGPEGAVVVNSGIGPRKKCAWEQFSPPLGLEPRGHPNPAYSPPQRLPSEVGDPPSSV